MRNDATWGRRVLSARLAWALAAMVLAASTGQAADRFIVIGTGGLTGVYYPTGGAICRLVNQDRKEHGIRCTVESTGGSIANLDMLRRRELDLGVVQSDWQFHAYRGTDKLADAGPFEELRALFSVHPEPFTVVARADSGIAHFDDLKGKRVNIGNPGSGSRATMEVVMAAMGWSLADFDAVSELPSTEMSEALCRNQIDAIVFTVGHPSGSIQEATTVCDGVLVEVSGPAIDALVEDNPYYRHATIPGGTYRNNSGDVVTFGVGATIVGPAWLPDEVAYTVVRSVFENLDRFRSLHPAFGALKADEMVTDGLSVPFHAGAETYYKEAGLL